MKNGISDKTEYNYIGVIVVRKLIKNGPQKGMGKGKLKRHRTIKFKRGLCQILSCIDIKFFTLDWIIDDYNEMNIKNINNYINLNKDGGLSK